MIEIDIHPVAFTVGSLEVTWYGIFIALAVLTMILWMYRQIEKRRAELPVPPDMAIAPIGILGGVIGAKLVHVAEQPALYLQNPLEIFNPGGFAIYGGILGATLGIWIYLKLSRRHLKNQYFGYFVDLAAPGIILAQAVGRMGCVLNGCCHGAAAADWVPWSVIYTNPATESCVLPGVAIHPTQGYEIVFALIGFGVLLKLRNRLKPVQGALFLVYFIMYSAWRFGLGYLRLANVYYLGLSQAQIISIVIMAISIGLLIRLQRRHRKASAPASDSDVDTTAPPPAT